MRDFHIEQLDGTYCGGKNCAVCCGAMAAFFGTRGASEMTAAQFRRASGISCVPGRDTPSGGITVNAIERVLRSKGVSIDYRGGLSYIRRWSELQGRSKLSSIYGAIMLGDYDAVPWPWRAKGSTFRGYHSVWVHDYRVDRGDSHYNKIQPTVCWHDPLREKPIRIPWSVAVKYWQKSGSTVRGYAGFVKIPAVPGGSYAVPMLDRTRTKYDSVNVRSGPSVRAVVKRRIKPKGRLVQIAMYKKGDPWGSGPNKYMWGATSLLGNEWVHLNRLDNVRGST